jgi:hypothetical protein
MIIIRFAASAVDLSSIFMSHQFKQYHEELFTANRTIAYNTALPSSG